MSDLSPRLGLPYLQASQAQKHVTHNDALQRLDQLVQLRLTTVAATTPAEDPAPGECHALAAGPGGLWSGQGGQLACWDGVAWQFLPPAEGWLAWDLEAGLLRVWQDGTLSWDVVEPEQVQMLGVAIAADETNRLAVAAPATLLTHVGNGHQLKVNKAATAETASLLFQSDWTGHAELGLTGDNALTLKASADGVSWYEVMRADPVAQSISWAPDGASLMTLDAGMLQLNVPITGTAVQADAIDTTSARLMAVGAFGLGGEDSAAVRMVDGTADLPSGFYSGKGSWADVATFPNANCRFRPFLNITRRVSSGVYEQLRLFFDAGTMYMQQADSDGVWDDPIPFVSLANLLGPVSQSAGLPTGAVIECGSTASGDYIRWADGSQICSHSATASAAATSVWTFPVDFAFVPGISATANSVAAHFANHNGASVSSLNFDAWDTTGARAALSCDLMAIGRWF